MRVSFITFSAFILLWGLLGAYLIGFIDLSGMLPENILALELPRTTTELGDSLAILDGLFSSIAIVLGLMAIIFQGRELKESTKAQAEQAQALSMQMHQQTESNKVAAYTARLQFLLQETDRLGIDINRLFDEVNKLRDEDRKREKQRILDNTLELRKRYRSEAKSIDETIAQLLNKLT